MLLALDGVLVNLLETLHLNPKFSYVVRIAAVVALLAYFWRDYFELNVKPIISDFLYAAVAGGIVFIVWIFPYPEWLGGGDVSAFNPYQGESQLAGLWWASVRLMGRGVGGASHGRVVLASALMSCAGLINRISHQFSPERVSGYAYLGSACLFALEHHLWLCGLIAGLRVWGTLQKRIKTYGCRLRRHAVTNALLGI